MFRRRRKHDPAPRAETPQPRQRPPKRGRALLALVSVILLFCLGGLALVIADPREWPHLPGIVPSSTLETVAVLAGHPARPISLDPGSVATHDPAPQPRPPEESADPAAPLSTAALPPTGRLGETPNAARDLPPLDWSPFDTPQPHNDDPAPAAAAPLAPAGSPQPVSPPGETSLPAALPEELAPLAQSMTQALTALQHRSDERDAQIAAIGNDVTIILESLPHPAALADHRLESIEERLIGLQDAVGSFAAAHAAEPPSAQQAADGPPRAPSPPEDAARSAPADHQADPVVEAPVRPTPVAPAQTWRPGRVWQAPAAHFRLSTRIPADLANIGIGDWLPGYGRVLHVAPVNGGRLINTENGALFDPEPGTAAPLSGQAGP